MTFQTPMAFVLLFLIPLIFLIPFPFRKRSYGLNFSSTYQLKIGVKSLRQRFILLPKILMAAGLILAVTALARPGESLDETRNVTEGVAMELVLDRSGSMNAELQQGKNYIRRIDIVKKTVLDFVIGTDSELPGRPDDLIGLIAFARYADTLSPISMSHKIISEFIDSLDTVKIESEDGTAIGDAVALAAARLKSIDEKKQEGKGYTIKSKIIILLTDGENNAGKYSPGEAAELAEKWGIKIYAIGFAGEASYVTDSFFGPKRIPVGSAVNSDVLKQLSEQTGGTYFHADTAEELEKVYTEIDKLEKSELVSYSHIEYKELFPGFLFFSLVLISVSKLLSLTVLRRLP